MGCFIHIAFQSVHIDLLVYQFQLDDTVSYILLSLLFGTVSPSPVSYLVSEGRRPV